MNIEEIKGALKKLRISREELGAKLGVSKASVDNWLCGSRPIPAAKLKLIEMMLQPAPQAAPAIPPLDLSSVKIINVRLTAEELDLCIRAARACHMELEEWARLTILDATRTVLRTQAETAAPASGKGGKHP